jgi:CRISPR-associated protein Cas1
VQQQRAGDAEASDALLPRKLWPPRDDGIHVVAQRQGVRVGVRGASLRFSDEEGTVVSEVPLAGVESLTLLGSVQLSTQALHVLADRRIPVAYLTAAGRPVAVIDPLDSTSALVRRAQVRRLENPSAALELARAVISAKIANQRTLLMRNAIDLPAPVSEAILAEAERAARADSLSSLRGHEGQAAALYFESFPRMLRGPVAREFQENGRERRPPPDPVNACLSLAYSILCQECAGALRVASLDPAIGALHSPKPGRPALALDLLEPFRPLIADSVAVAALNRGELTEGHFLRTSAGCALTDAGRKAFFAAYGRRMDTVVTHPVFEYRLSYRRMIVLHARMVAAWLVGEVPTLAFLTTR